MLQQEIKLKSLDLLLCTLTATVVAEKFGKGGKFKTPVIESTGTGGGMKLFCAGVGSKSS